MPWKNTLLPKQLKKRFNSNSLPDSDISDSDSDIPLSEVLKRMQTSHLNVSFKGILPMPDSGVEDKRNSIGAQILQILPSAFYKDDLEVPYL